MRRVSWRARLAAALMSVMTAAAVFGMSLTAMAATSTEAANVRSEASSDGNLLGVLYPGTQAAVLDEVTGDDGNTWYHIEFSLDGNTITGYVRGDLLTDIDAEVNLDAAEEAETEEAPQEETQEAAAEETTPEQMPEAQEAAAIGEDEPGEVTAVPVPEQVPADFNPMTDPSAQFEMRFKDNGDGTGSWVAYNEQTDKEFGLTDSSAAAPAPETVKETSPGGWRTAAIINGIIALCAIALLVYMLHKLNRDRETSRVNRANRLKKQSVNFEEPDELDEIFSNYSGEKDITDTRDEEDEDFDDEDVDDDVDDEDVDDEEIADDEDAAEADDPDEDEDDNPDEDEYYRVDYKRERRNTAEAAVPAPEEAEGETEPEAEAGEAREADEAGKAVAEEDPEEEPFEEEEDFYDDELEEEDFDDTEEFDDEEDFDPDEDLEGDEEEPLFEGRNMNDGKKKRKGGSALGSIGGFFKKVFAADAEEDEDLDESFDEEDEEGFDDSDEDFDDGTSFASAEFEDGDPDDFRIFDDHKAKRRNYDDEEEDFESREYPEDKDLTPEKEEPAPAPADAEPEDYREVKKEEDRPGLSMQKVMRGVEKEVQEDDEFVSDEILDDDLTDEDLESVLFDDDDDMEYSFLNTRKK
ncbi:MAG: SH3 domain-containing protein [Lachnospiraceae bacterium]|nr:SH3 domain-containing protein [Lachnospiraceae bacterium]